MSGIEMAYFQHERLRVLCLTSAPDSRDPRGAFQKFVKRCRRRYHRFEYIRADEFTESGLLHFHVIYKGQYMGQRWVSETWNSLNGAKIVYMTKFRGNKRRLGSYLVKYMSKRLAGRRSSWSQGWVFRGFVKVWRFIVQYNRANPLGVWLSVLRRRASEFDPGQAVLDWWSKRLMSKS